MLRDHSQSQIASAETAAEKLTEQTASTETACHRGVDCCCTEEPMISVAAFFPRAGIRLIRSIAQDWFSELPRLLFKAPNQLVSVVS
jgi:hypothetical protein